MNAKKPDRVTAMYQLIAQVKDELPLYEPDTFFCGPNNSCVGCPKKLMELVDSELCYWEHQLSIGTIPHFDEISRFAKLCKNVRRGLVRNNLVSP